MQALWGFIILGMIVANAIVNPGIISILLVVMFALTIAYEVGKKLG